MNQNHIIAYEYLAQAQDALRRGDRKNAQELCELAKQIAPNLEEVWLLQASLAEPADSVRFLERALKINPHSDRARRGLQWAQNRLASLATTSNEAQSAIESDTSTVDSIEPIVDIPSPESAQISAPSRVQTRPWITILSVFLMVCVIGVGWLNRSQVQSSLSKILNSQNAGSTWSSVDPSAAETPISLSATPTTDETSNTTKKSGTLSQPTSTNTVEITASPIPSTLTATLSPSATATAILMSVTPAPLLVGMPSPTPLPTDTEQPGFVPYATPTDAPLNVPLKTGNGGVRWIDVDLTNQMVYAYEGDTIVNSFLASTGTWEHPTVTGQYNIYVKYTYTDMSGVGYYLADVPNTMYFYQGYAIHGTYWHNNFGTPMSHGCVNLSIADSAWIFDFASVGTLVNIHY